MKEIDLIAMQVNITTLATSLQMRLSTIEARKELTEQQKAVRDDLKALVQIAWEAKGTAKELEEEFKRMRSICFVQETEVQRLTVENEELKKINKNFMQGI